MQSLWQPKQWYTVVIITNGKKRINQQLKSHIYPYVFPKLSKVLFWFGFLAVLWFELRALYLLGRNTLLEPTPLSIFALVILEIGLTFCPG
jgi:hypothetical protein